MIPVPHKLFKYMQRVHAEDFVNTGCVRIGTLMDFQKTEKHGLEIGDACEGMRFTRVSADLEGEIEVQNLSFRGINFSGTISNCDNIFGSYERSTQYYLFCMSTKADKAAMIKMGYDTCVQITNFPYFREALTYELLRIDKLGKRQSSRSLYDSGPCRHKTEEVIDGKHLSNTVIPTNPVPIYFHKHPDFGYQTEARIVWTPKEPETAIPFIMHPSEIKKFCKIVTL